MGITDIAHANIGLCCQGVKIGEIGDMRYLHHGDVDIAPRGSQVFSLLQRHAVFIFQIDIQPRHHAEHRNAG